MLFASGMSRVIVAAVLAFACAMARGGEPQLDAAVRSLAEGLPQVAAAEFREILASGPDVDRKRAAQLGLARAELATGEPGAALALLDDAAIPGPDAQFWRGKALAKLGRWPEALASFEAVGDKSELADDALLGRAEALSALGRAGEAAAVFEKLSMHPRFGREARLREAAVAIGGGHLDLAASLLASIPTAGRETAQEIAERQCLIGQLRLAQGQPALAEQIFAAAVYHPEGVSERVLIEDYRGWVRACLGENQTPRAEDVLEAFIERYPRLSVMPAMLEWLGTLYARVPPPDDLADLRRWSADSTESGRQAFATLGLARGELQAGRAEKAEAILAGFGAAFPTHPLRCRALLDLARLQLHQGRAADAHASLDDARKFAPTAAESKIDGEIDALDAEVSLAEGDPGDAALKFDALSARLGNSPLAEEAAFNGVLAWTRANDSARAVTAEAAFEARFPNSILTVEFPLEEALSEAAHTSIDDPTGRQRATARLRSFLRDQPTHPRAAEARIALAELAYMRVRPNLPAAWRQIAAPEIRQVQNDGGRSADRADYLAIWLADSAPSRDENAAIARAKAFLERRPDSPLAPEVSMKLSEIYFRQEDYSDAETQLELLAERWPASALTEQALYLAGLAASRSMSPAGLDKAVTLFESAASHNGPLKLPARLRQAEVQNRVDRARDALILYDGVIAATAGDDLSAGDLESRCAALAGRGETLFALGATDPKLYAGSAEAFDQLVRLPGASLAWRRQALTKRGRALEKSGDLDGALVAYDQTLNLEARPGEAPEPEWTWYYRAAYDAARLLETRADWSAAIAIYKKVAAADGPLKSEFESLLRRRRLEHFVWEE